MTCAGLLFFATPARADASEDTVRAASRTFAEGEKAFRGGDYTRAGESFEAAYGLVPHEDALWNAARAWQRAGETARAANLYARYLREANAGSRDRTAATNELSNLATRVGRIVVNAPETAAVRIDDTSLSAHASLYVNPGTHLVVMRDGEREQRQTPAVGAGQVVNVAFSAPVIAMPPPRKEEPEHHGWNPWVAYAGAGGTVIAGIATILSGVDTRQTRDAFFADRSEELLDEGRGKQARTNALLGVTAGLAVVTVITAIVLVDWRQHR